MESLKMAISYVWSKDWVPTSENINALPEPLRKFIHELESFQYTEMIATNFELEMQLEGAVALIKSLKEEG